MKDTTQTLHDARLELSEILQEDIPFKEQARGALKVGQQYLNVENGHLTRIDQETDHWEAIVSTDSPDEQFPEGLTLDLQTSYCRRTLTAESPITLHDAPNQGWATDAAFEEHGLHCYHGTTLHINGEPYGTVCFVSEDPRREPFSEEETLFIEYLTQSLERELERDQYEAKLTRQTNLSLVLDRILRHNLRNDIAVIRGFTQLMANQLDDEFYSNIVLTKIDNFIDLCEKARELDRIVAAEFEREPTEIVSVVREVIEDVTQAFPAASITIEYDDEITAAVFPSFKRAITELVENAAKHGGDTPIVTVTVETVPNAIEVRITDDGPGLATHEASVLDTGTETPLTHGTGLGLWLTHWIVTGHDGSITATNTGDGTTLKITIPRLPIPDVQKQLQELTRARGQYQAAFEEAGDGMTIINNEARIVDLNDEAAAMYGEERQQLLGHSIQDFLPDEFNFDAEWDAIQAADTRRDEIPIVRSDGRTHSIEYTAKTDVIPGLHLIISRDVTERKERERELAETRERFQTFVENSNDIISIVDAEGIAQYQSPAVERILGHAPDALVGENIFEYIHPNDREYISEQFERLVTRPGTTSDVFEFRFKHTDGSWVWLESTASNRTATVVDGFVINSRDVTERKKQEQSLEQTTQRLESIIKVSPDPIIAIDTNGTITVWNEVAEDVFGFPADAVIGEQIRSIDLFEGEQATLFEERFERVIAGETIRDREIQLQTERGDTVHLSLSVAPLRDASERVIGAISVAKDITEYRESERELEQRNERLEAFASLVSHDLRNPLSVAEGRLELASEECDSEHFEQIRRAHERMRVLIDDLLTLARAGASVADFDSVDLGAIAPSCWANVETTDATLLVEATQTIRADESRLKQLLENLMRNAIEHGGEGVTVTIGDLNEGFYIEDDGSGIPEEIRDEIFETGSSTNQDGTGFGLSIVRQIVAAHEWEISVTESSDGGARFEITGVNVTAE